MSLPSTIAGLNQLPTSENRNAYFQIIPPELLEFVNIRSDLRDSQEKKSFILLCLAGSPDAETALYQSADTVDIGCFAIATNQVAAYPYFGKITLNDEIGPTSKKRTEVMTV